MIYLLVASAASCLTMLVAGVLNGTASYRDGFLDGCHYMCDDEHPSKPHITWEGWDDVRKLRRGWWGRRDLP